MSTIFSPVTAILKGMLWSGFEPETLTPLSHHSFESFFLSNMLAMFSIAKDERELL